MFKVINKQPNSPVYFSKMKVKMTGYVIEVAHFERDFMLFYKNRKKTERKQKVNVKMKTMNRAKRLITDYIHSNSWHWYDEEGQRYNPIFISLTFRDNVQDYDYANYEFTKFIRRVNYEIYGTKKSKLKYLCVIERQKRGAIHYHMIVFNLPYVERIYDKFRELWKHGSSNIKAVKGKSGSISGYLTKYIIKEVDGCESNRKSYFASRGLLKPVVNSIEEVVILIESNLDHLPVHYQYEREFQIGEKRQKKEAKLYDLRNRPIEYDQISNILKIYEY